MQRLSLLDLAHVAAVLLLARAAWLSLLAALVLGWLLLALRDALPARLRAPGLVGLVLLVGALLLHVRSPLAPGLGAGPLAFLGVSYFALRLVYALVDPRRWTLTGWMRYACFAPTFLTGPILGPEELLDAPRLVAAARKEGAARMLWGALKLGLAWAAANVVPLASARQLHWLLHEPAATAPWAWVAVISSGAWLYLEFSAWTDLAIGVAAVCGVRARENFARPFAASDPTAFWRGWHVSLGDWLRAVVYGPLAALLLRVGPAGLVAVLAPIATMVVCGAWHRASPDFLLWGGVHGCALGLHAAWTRLAPAALDGLRAAGPYRALAWVATQGFVAASWALFLPADPVVTLEARLALLRRLVGMTA